MIQLKFPENSRTYHYQDGTKVMFNDVTAVEVTKSGFHKLDANGKFIVAPGWRYISLDTKEWAF